jgi:hypothetical protein
MKNAEPKSKPHHQTKLLNGFCMVLCIEAVEKIGVNAPAILFECELRPGDGGCVGHEPSTWLCAPLASLFTHIWPSGLQYHHIRGHALKSSSIYAIFIIGTLVKMYFSC